MPCSASFDPDLASANIAASSAVGGELRLIVRRPKTDTRESLSLGRLDFAVGLEGDTWASSHGADPQTQLTLMNVRVLEALQVPPDRWPLAGDQLYVDMDLSVVNLPVGTRLALGTTVLQITEIPHTGCRKFRDRFGGEALSFINSPRGRELRMRGVYAQVLQSGEVRVGDRLRKQGV